MSKAEVEARVADFITATQAGGQGSVGPEDQLLVDGIIDSLGLLDLVSFVEDDFGIVVEDREVDLDNFGSVRRIAAFVLSKTETST